MIVYHGSDSNFKHLRIDGKLVKHESTRNNEGLGIYFTTNLEVAKSYGKYVYTIEIANNVFADFRERSRCRIYVGKIAQHIYKQLKIDILNYFSLEDFTDRMYWGGQAIFRVGHDIAEILDNTEEFYFAYSQSKRQSVYSMLHGVDKRVPTAYMFNYHIKDIGVIKRIDDNCVRIIDKQETWRL